MKLAAALMSAAALSLALPVATRAQDAAPAAAPAATSGLAIADITALMTAQGLEVSAVETDGERRYVSVADGPLRWVAFFQSCEAEVCSDLQFSIGFSSADITMDRVNGWNRNRRFVKAFFDPAAATEGAQPSTAAQYDAFLNGTHGVGQVADHLAVWRSLALEFARYMSPQTGFQAAPAPTAEPAAPAGE